MEHIRLIFQSFNWEIWLAQNPFIWLSWITENSLQSVEIPLHYSRTHCGSSGQWRERPPSWKGDATSPTLFTACLEVVELLDYRGLGWKISVKYFSSLRFSNDIVPFTNDEWYDVVLPSVITRQRVKQSSRPVGICARVRDLDCLSSLNMNRGPWW